MCCSLYPILTIPRWGSVGVEMGSLFSLLYHMYVSLLLLPVHSLHNMWRAWRVFLAALSDPTLPLFMRWTCGLDFVGGKRALTPT